jgi:uncharacterized protein YjiS (DUF1127 family)
MSTMPIGSVTLRRTNSWRILWFFKQMKKTFALWQSRVAARNELATLDDATLRDIGMSRSTARYEALKRFWSE